MSLSEGDGGEEGKNEPPPLKRNSSALNVAKLLKKTISKHNLHAANSESSEGRVSNHHTGLNGHVSSFSHENTNGDIHASTEQDSLSSDHQAESVNQKHNRKKDSCSLATVTEETNGDGETEERYSLEGANVVGKYRRWWGKVDSVLISLYDEKWLMHPYYLGHTVMLVAFYLLYHFLLCVCSVLATPEFGEHAQRAGLLWYT